MQLRAVQWLTGPNNDMDALRYSELSDPVIYAGRQAVLGDAFEINPDSIALGIMPKLMDYMGKNLVPLL